jgi:hypothetical protein
MKYKIRHFFQFYASVREVAFDMNFYCSVKAAEKVIKKHIERGFMDSADSTKIVEVTEEEFLEMAARLKRHEEGFEKRRLAIERGENAF